MVNKAVILKELKKLKATFLNAELDSTISNLSDMEIPTYVLLGELEKIITAE